MICKVFRKYISLCDDLRYFIEENFGMFCQRPTVMYPRITMKYTFYIIVALFLSSCAAQAPDGDELYDIQSKIFDTGLEDYELAMAQTDSLEQSGRFSAARADETRSIVCMNADRNRLAYYYAERGVKTAEQSGSEDDADVIYSSKRVMSDCKLKNGEYGKAVRIANGLLQEFEGDTSDVGLTMKAAAYSLIAECNDGLKNNSEAEKYYLASIKTLYESFHNPIRFEQVEPLFYNAATLLFFYIDNSMYEKALPLVPMLDTALSRMEKCPDVGEFELQMRKNNYLIVKAMALAVSGDISTADSLYEIHRQTDGLSDVDIATDARYLDLSGRYKEAVRLYEIADSIHCALDEPLTDDYIECKLKAQYDALCKTGDVKATLQMADRIRILTDSLRLQEHLEDVEQEEEILRQEHLIAEKHSQMTRYRALAAVVLAVCLMIAILLWRSAKYNKILDEKNRRLIEEINQREENERQALEQLKEDPEAALTAGQQLFRKICELMDGPEHVFTDADFDRSALARLIGTNEHYISDAISECTGAGGVTDFINGYRLRYATQLLAETDDSIALIAEMSGFSRRTFYRVFGEAYSMSPADYRKISKKHA